MSTRNVLALVVFVLFGTAMAQTRSHRKVDPVHYRAKTTLGQSDAKFVKEAYLGHMSEIRLGKLARKRGQSPFVKSFGETMVRDHQQAMDSLELVAADKGVRVPKQLDKVHMALWKKLSALRGERFDAAYRQEMLKDHKKDYMEFKEKAEGAKDRDVRAYADKFAPIVKHHLDMLEGQSGRGHDRGH